MDGRGGREGEETLAQKKKENNTDVSNYSRAPDPYSNSIKCSNLSVTHTPRLMLSRNSDDTVPHEGI